MACTTDNATNNDTLMSILETVCKSKNIEFTAYDNHVRCLAHVINLAAQAALSKLKVGYVEHESEILDDNGEINDVIPKVITNIIYLIILIDFNAFLLCSFVSLLSKFGHLPKEEKS
jgi:hypothetical protein